MLDCLILGDSIAVGVGQVRPGCMTVARSGITSGAFMQTLFPGLPKAASNVVISLGVNDDAGVATLENLRRLRAGIAARQVTWLLPGLKDGIRRHVRTVAQENRDRVVDTAPEAGPDRLHPTGNGYRLIANWTEQGATPAAYEGPHIVPMTGALARPGAAMLPRIVTPSTMPVVGGPGSLYASWPPPSAAYAAIPPRDYAYRAFQPALPRPTLR